MTGTITPELPSAAEPRGTSDSKVKGSLITIRDGLNALLNSENKIPPSSLASGVTWYTPSVIATEESRTNTAYGTLTTADQITGIVVPSNGKLCINFRAHVKSSVAAAGAVALFLGSNQLKNPLGLLVETTTVATSFRTVYPSGGTLTNVLSPEGVEPTTGVVIGDAPLEVTIPAGTYTLTARYKASSGSITAKERTLWACTFG